MFGDFLKTHEPDDPQSLAEPQPVVPAPPSTAKKRNAFGRSGSRLEPLRIGAIPGLSQMYSELAKKERRSHGAMSSRNDSHEWIQSNNTIPETLNSSKEWNIHYNMAGNHSASQNDVRDVSELTPSKSSQVFHSSLKAPPGIDKENFYTPRKISEVPVAVTPANRCPLSALPVDSAPDKDATDGERNDILKDLHESSSQSEENAASKSNMTSSKYGYDSEGFRTPQCKPLISHQNLAPSNSYQRPRLYALSSTKALSNQPNIPLHPAVAAGQQQARKLQLEREAQAAHQPAAAPLEMSASRRLGDTTPFKCAPTNSSLRQTPGHQVQVAVERQPSITEQPSSSSTWLPHLKTGPMHSVTSEKSNPWRQEAEVLPPSSKRKLETQDLAEPLPEHDQSLLRAKLSPEPAKVVQSEHLKSHKIIEPAKVIVASLQNVPEPVQDAKIVPQAVKTEEPVKVTVTPSTLMPEQAQGAKCPQQQSVKVPEQALQAFETVNPEKKTCVSGNGQIAVNGHVYSILSLLGRGGSSKVFQVLDPENSQLKAVKCVNLAETDQSIREGYLNEIKLLAELQDGDCVIRMYDHEHQKENSTLFVVMEKGDTDLSKLIKDVNKSKKISAAMIVYYWTEMLNAVNFIHKRGTIHSDLKPANFLLVSGRLKLIDFGIASSVQEDMTSVVKDSLTGTYNYISPEALCTSSNDAQSFKISYKSDVWSLGCILYSLVYGRTPFQHISGQFQKLNAIVNPAHRIQFPEPSVERCPSALIEAMKLCLVRNPKERASVDELLQINYLEQTGPERGILSQFASLAASVGIVQESEENRYAVVIRAMQRLIMKNERQLPFLAGRK